MKPKLLLIATTLLWFPSIPLFGANADGCYGTYYTRFEVLEVAPNRMVLTANGFGMGFVTEDPSSPLKGAAGPCLFHNEVIDGKPKGEARCVRTDQDGDKLMVIGAVKGLNETGMMGTWKIVGLTGEWIGASGNGDW